MKKKEILELLEKLINQRKKIFDLFILYTDTGPKKGDKAKESYLFPFEYNKWYTQALIVVKYFLPERYEEFESMYKAPVNRKKIDRINYTIYDSINNLNNYGLSIYPRDAQYKLITQFCILESIEDLIENKLDEINSILEYDIFEKEIDAAKHLLKNKYMRSAGAICGVIIEKHLIGVLEKYNISITKKAPGINDLNQLLYNNSIIDSTEYKLLTYLGDIRNKCDHNKQDEPTKEDVQALIDGTEKVIKTFN